MTTTKRKPVKKPTVKQTVTVGRPVKEPTLTDLIMKLKQAKVIMIALKKTHPNYSQFLHRKNREIDHMIIAFDKRK